MHLRFTGQMDRLLCRHEHTLAQPKHKIFTLADAGFSLSLPSSHLLVTMLQSSTATARLPPEVLENILASFALDALVKLMRVCAHWRAVILCHPTYTSKLVLPNDASTARVDFFVLQAERAVLRGRLLDVDVDLSRGEARLSAVRVIEAMSRAAAQLKALRLVICAEAWAQVEEPILHTDAPRLRRLELNVLPSNPEMDPYEHAKWLVPNRLNAPLLDTLLLSGLDLPRTFAPLSLAHVRTFHYTWPWSTPEPNVIPLSIIRRVFPALSVLALTGHIELVARAATDRLILSRLALQTRTCGTQWATLQPHLVDVQNVECWVVSKDGVAAIAAQLQPPLMISSTHEAGAAHFKSTGACGKTFALVYGNSGSTPPVDREDVSEEINPDDEDEYLDGADEFDSPRHESLVVDSTALIPHYNTTFVDVDLWDIPRDPDAVDPEYSGLHTCVLSWSNARPPAPVILDGVQVVAQQLNVPLGCTVAWSRCPNLRTFRLENRTWSEYPVWVQLDDLHQLIENSLFDLDLTQVELHLAGVRLVGAGTVRPTFACTRVVSLESSPYPLPVERR